MILAGPVVFSSASDSIFKPCSLSSHCRSRTSVKDSSVLMFCDLIVELNCRTNELLCQLQAALDFDFHRYTTQLLFTLVFLHNIDNS